MLQLEIHGEDFWDERTCKFVTLKSQILQLEHSLVSISKWEAKYKKPFLSREIKTREETVEYIRAMTITQNVNPLVYSLINDEHIRKVNEYIDDPMSATTIKKQEGKGAAAKVITSEEIYASMVEFRVPPEYQKWHFNRLMMLLRVLGERSKPPKKMRKGEIARRNRSLNAARRARSGSKG
jgi:hypothetical protein